MAAGVGDRWRRKREGVGNLVAWRLVERCLVAVNTGLEPSSAMQAV